MKKLCCLFLLILASTLFAQPASRSAFFVANEGQWPSEFAFRFDGGGGSWFITNDGLTIDLKQYEVSPKTGFGGKEEGYASLDPFNNREHRNYSVKGHVIKVNLVRDDLVRAPRTGASLPSVYIYQLRANGFTDAKKCSC